MAIEEIEDACVEELGRGARSKASSATCHERLLGANDVWCPRCLTFQFKRLTL
jgi:hypothetical protein